MEQTDLMKIDTIGRLQMVREGVWEEGERGSEKAHVCLRFPS